MMKRERSQGAVALWVFLSRSWTSIVRSSLKSSGLTDMLKEIHIQENGSMLQDVRRMLEFLLDASCNGVMGVPITFFGSILS